MTRIIGRTIGRIGLLILFFFAYQLVSLLLINATDTAAKAPLVSGEFLLYTTIAGSLLLIGFMLLYRRQLHGENPRKFGFTTLTFKRVALFIACFAAMLGVQLLWEQLIIHHVLPSPQNQTMIEQAVNKLPLWNNFYDVFAAPIFEEFIFRGFFFNYFFNHKTKRTAILGILVSGLIFGYLHTLDFSVSTLLYSSLGWILAGAYLYFKDLRYPIGLHVLNNFLSII